jgi:hypothetical protein
MVGAYMSGFVKLTGGKVDDKYLISLNDPKANYTHCVTHFRYYLLQIWLY